MPEPKSFLVEEPWLLWGRANAYICGKECWEIHKALKEGTINKLKKDLHNVKSKLEEIEQPVVIRQQTYISSF